nr:EVE domain-containing protein [Gemmatimonadota bacterium]
TWYMVDLKAVRPMKKFVALAELRENPALAEMWLFKRNRLSVTPVTEAEYKAVLKMGGL